MSWHYSQALEEAFSEACSSDGALSALWKSTPTAPDDSCSAKMKGTCHRSPFGMMFVPSTDAHGEALLTWFRAGFPARTSALQAKAQESTESEAGCGVKWPASFARYSHDTRSWKTVQLSLLEGLDEFSETWPKWGWMHDGVCSVLSMLERAIEGIGYSLSHAPAPTPTKTMILEVDSPLSSGQITESPSGYIQKTSKNGHPGSASWQLWVSLKGFVATPMLGEVFMGWPTDWTAAKPLETDKFQRWLGSHGRYYMEANRCGNAHIDGMAATGRLMSIWDRLAYKFPEIAAHAEVVWSARKDGRIRRLIESDARFVDLLVNQEIGPQSEDEWELLARATLTAIGMDQSGGTIPCSGCGKPGTTVFCSDCARNQRCPHGNKMGECSDCDVAGDLAFDSLREDARRYR